MDDLNILLKATLDINKSVDNINKQILQVQDKLKNVNISLNIDDFKNELEKAFGSIESKVKKTKENKLEFQGIKETAKQIKELSGSLENIYKDLKKVGDVKSLKNIYDTDGNVSGFNLQLEKTMGNLKEISNYNVFGQYNKETQEYEYALTKVNSTLKEIDNSNKKISETNKKSSQMSNAKNLQAYYDNARKYVLEVEKGAMDATEALAKLESVMMKSDKSGFTWQFDGLSSQQQKAILSDRNKLENQILQSKKAQYNVEKQIEQSQDKQVATAIKHSATIKEMNSKINSLQGKYGGSVDSSELARIKAMVSELEKLDPATKTYAARVAETNKAITALTRNSADGFKKTQDAISDTTSKTSQLGLAMRTLGQLFMVGSPIFLAQQVFRDMATSVNEVNKALTDIRIVTDMSSEEALVLRDSYNELGRTIGATTNEMLTGATEWFRQGKSIAETQDLITASITGAKLAGIESAQMSEFLTATLNGFQLSSEKAISVVDKMVAVDNAAATSVTELAIAMQQTSASAQMAGVNIDELLGYIGTVSSVTRRSAEVVGQSFKTIFSRFQNIKLGQFTEDGIVASDVIKAMDAVGVKVMENENTFRDFGNVIQELSGKWNSLNQAEQISVANAMAGVRQRESFLVLMNNMSDANDLTALSMDSAGLATDRFNTYLESTAALLNEFKATAEAVFMETLSSDTINNMIRLGIASLEFVENIGGLVPLLTTIVGMLAIVKSNAIATFLTSMTKSVLGVGTSLNILKSSLVGMVMQMKGVQTATTMTAMTMQSLVPIIGLVTIAISGLVMGMNAYSQAQEERVSKAKDSANAINDELKSTSQLMTRYKELSVVENKTKEQRQELLDIQKQLSEMHGVEARNLDILNKSYEENAKIIDKAVEAKRRYLEIDNNIISADVDNKLADAMSNLMTGSVYEFTGDNGIGEAFRKLNQELQNAFDVDTSGRGFVLKITPDIDENLALKAMDELLKNMESLGQSKTDGYLKLANMYKELSNAIAEKNDMDKDSIRLANETKMMSIANEKGVKDLSKATIEQVEAMEQLYIARAVAEKGQTHALQAQNEFRVAMAETNPEYAKYIGYTTTTTKEVGTLAEELANVTAELQAQKIETIQQSENYALLIASIEKLNSGQQLSGEEVYRLTSAYKDLTPKINEATGEMYLESEALIKLATKQGEDAQQGITAQINKTKQVAHDTLTRIGLIGKEVLAINSLASAYSMLASNATTTTGGYRPVGIDDETWSKSANNMSAGINSIIQDLADLYAEAEKTSTGINKSIDWEEGLKDKKSSSKGNKPSDKFKKELEEIKLIREKLEREIAELQESINLDTLLGKSDPNKANKMTDLLDQLRGISEIQIGKFNGLAQIYKEQEQLGELESLIADARKQGYIDEQSYIQYTIDLLNQKYDVEKRAYDDKLRLLNYEQEYTHEDSQEYADIEQQKLDMVVAMQKSCMDKVRELKEKGLSDESEDVRKYIDLYKDMLEEQLNLEKSMAEKRKQLELDRLNDLQKDLGDKQSAMKSYIDMVMQMLRDQYNEEKKMIEDNYKLKQDKLKQELDSYKKIIDAKKKSLEDEANTEDYNDEVSKRQKELADMKANAALLGKDETAKAQYEKLLEEIAQKEKDLAKYQRDHNIKLQQESLDKEYDLYEENINKELDALEKQKENELEHVQKMLDSEVELRRKAIQLIEKDNDKLYKQLQKWAEETGKKTQDEVSDAWNGCTDAINTYNDGQMNVLDTLDKISQKLKDVKFDLESVGSSHWTDWDNSSSTGNGNSYNKPSGGSNTSSRDKKIEEMIKLGDQMKGKKKEEVDKLLAQQQKIASEIGAFFENDTWYLMFNGKKVPIRQAIGVRHNGLFGGRVGDGMKANEKLMKLTTDEWVINDSQYKMLNKNIDNLIGSKPNGDITITFDTLMKVDKIDKNVDIDALTTKATDMVFKKIKSNFNIRGIK